MSYSDGVPMGQAQEVVRAIESGEILENEERLGRLVCWCFYWYQRVPFGVQEACQEVKKWTRKQLKVRKVIHNSPTMRLLHSPARLKTILRSK